MKTLKYFVLCAFSAFTLMNCGGKEEKKKEGFSYDKKETAAPAPTSEADSNEANIVIAGDDVMKFDKSEIKVKAGQKVKLTLRHTGKLNKQVMGHNFVLLKKDVDLAAFAGKAAVASSNDYIPEGSTDVIAHTKTIGGGETTVIEFDAPAAGTYDFLCSFPGHYAMMKGKFIVE
ncbi:azurin [Mariniflexile ostreae]|uniref:Azurin n=1 Tax=Mariniflexile ostreae TaxID=1520892 RepID=A0ABV5FBV6_9FLAO